MARSGLIGGRVVQRFVVVVCLLWIGFDGICIVSKLH